MTLMACSTTSFAKLQSYNYSDDMCEYQNTFEDSRFSRKQINDTLALYSANFWPSLEASDSFYDRIKQPPLHVLNQLKNEYEQYHADVSKLTPVHLPQYKKLKEFQLNSAKNYYDLNRLKLLGLRDPRQLLTQQYGQRCYVLAQRMNLTGEQLINAGRKTLLEFIAVEKQKGIQDEQWLKSQLTQYNDKIKQNPSAEKEAFSEIMNHWHNCVIYSLPDHDQFMQKLDPQKDLFFKSKMTCDY